MAIIHRRRESTPPTPVRQPPATAVPNPETESLQFFAAGLNTTLGRHPFVELACHEVSGGLANRVALAPLFAGAAATLTLASQCSADEDVYRVVWNITRSAEDVFFATLLSRAFSAAYSFEIVISLSVMNSRSAGWPSFVAAIPRSMAARMSPGSVIRSP